MSKPAPPRVELARIDTPLQPLTRLSESLGVEIWVKRDDLTGLGLSGNKIRKLEYLLGDAKEQGADTLVTYGGEQSNHCRATAGAAARLGLASHLVLRTQAPARPPVTQGNILLDQLFGASIQWIDWCEAKSWPTVLEHASAEIRKGGGKPYIIPEGGSNALGAWGYVECMRELGQDLAKLPDKKTTVVCATGSGGTHAGLAIGARLHGVGVDVASVNVCDNREYFVDRITGICDEFRDRYDGPNVRTHEVEIVDGYVGMGYAKSRHEELACIAGVARGEGLLLDPVYTGKAFFALLQELGQDPQRFGERVVFIHTGGTFGLFPIADRLAHASAGRN